MNQGRNMFNIGLVMSLKIMPSDEKSIAIEMVYSSQDLACRIY